MSDTLLGKLPPERQFIWERPCRLRGNPPEVRAEIEAPPWGFPHLMDEDIRKVSEADDDISKQNGLADFNADVSIPHYGAYQE